MYVQLRFFENSKTWCLPLRKELRQSSYPWLWLMSYDGDSWFLMHLMPSLRASHKMDFYNFASHIWNILLMEEIRLTTWNVKNLVINERDKLPINWCRISPINSMLVISPKSSVKKTSSHKIYLQKITTHRMVLSRCGHSNYLGVARGKLGVLLGIPYWKCNPAGALLLGGGHT